MTNENYLIVPLGEEHTIMQFQLEMLHNNPQPGILPVQTKVNNQEISLHYTLGLHMATTECFQNGVITSGEFLDFLLKLVDILEDSRNLLLNPASFVLDLPYIFIDQDTKDIALVYLPIEPRLDLQQSLISFFEKLQLALASLNSIRKEIDQVVDYLHRDYVNLYQLKVFLTKVRIQGPPNTNASKQKPFRLENKKNQLGEKREKGKNNLKENIYKKGKFQNISNNWRKLLFFVLSQAVIALLLFSSADFLNALGDPTVTYLALALVLGGINVLVLRKIFATVSR
ncbi:MAG: FHA domain-containing protein [bacterium]|nr:MAG: FHA domain-containing protein [bacterium]